mgnify:CR=1 FL=1
MTLHEVTKFMADILDNKLTYEFTEHQYNLYMDNRNLPRTQLCKLLGIDKLTLNFVTDRMRVRVNYKTDRTPNIFARDILELLKDG